jgi:beta-glucosidase-like glycosyl hydrolase
VRGEAATLDRAIVRRLVRRELGFEAVVLADALEMMA